MCHDRKTWKQNSQCKSFFSVMLPTTGMIALRLSLSWTYYTHIHMHSFWLQTPVWISVSPSITYLNQIEHKYKHLFILIIEWSNSRLADYLLLQREQELWALEIAGNQTTQLNFSAPIWGLNFKLKTLKLCTYFISATCNSANSLFYSEAVCLL